MRCWQCCLWVALLLSASQAHADRYAYVRVGDPVEITVVSAPLPEVTFGRFAARVLRGAGEVYAPTEFPQPVRVAPLPLTIDTTRNRVAAMRIRRTFEIGPELERLRVLTLRVRYQDGLIVTVNDVEVARRNLGRDVLPGALAQRSRGMEWESFYIEVSPGMLRSGTNVLALEVRPALVRLAPRIEVALEGNELESVTRGPLIQRLGERSASIVFETDVAVVGKVRFGTTASSYGRTVVDAAPTRHHELVLDGLEPGMAVHYQIVAGPDAGPDYVFHTAPPAEEVVRFIVYGDVRGGHAVHAEVLRAALAEAPDFIVSTGDMVLRGTDEADWQKYFELARDLFARVAIYPVMGNHDVGAADGMRKFEEIFALPGRPADCPPGAAWYSFDVGRVHVVALDSNRYDDDRQLSWLADDLKIARVRGARAIFAAAHKGPASRGPHGGDALALARYVPLLRSAQATVFFSGHDHLYERGSISGLPYVVSGGGGAPLYPPRCGVAGKPPCKPDGAELVVSAHHYVVIEVYRDDVRLCAKRPDGTLLEACHRILLNR